MVTWGPAADTSRGRFLRDTGIAEGHKRPREAPCRQTEAGGQQPQASALEHVLPSLAAAPAPGSGLAGLRENSLLAQSADLASGNGNF